MSQKVHTRITQEHVDDLTTAVSAFGTKKSDGSMPLVLVPKQRVWGDPILKVPAGVYCLLQIDGQDAGLIEEGLHKGLIAPKYRIAYAVSRQSSTYDAPVQSCPTADNVMVNVDVVLIFNITDPKLFAYDLGASRFDELLSGNVEEAIRGLIRSKLSNEMYELRGSQVSSLLSDLIEKFKSFGVSFSDAKITNIELPQNFSDTLARTTVYNERIRVEQKNYEFEQQNLSNRINLAHQELARKNDIRIVNKREEKNRAIINQRTQLTKAAENRNTHEIEAREQADVIKLQATANLNKSVKDAERAATLLVSKHKADLVNTNKECAAQITKAKAIAAAVLKEAEANASSIRAMATAEGDAAEMLAEKRAFDIEIARKRAYAQVAETARIIISDENGKSMLEKMGM
ncbi:hypothetical protein J8273_5868 [Carpediemonas membranifera]|uniref:Band 7 domain-containing protein n=1 Tax=Carpediemonas membranifera TaxID=201153 RepID=A0A8J6B4C5_9EUKA|nr:hypothetical protein J8273_5868 [Carpediemonas membranifera]|eukprot:KAG9392729.1 hypothetical protein J8273_5868 [Carpediemonas membranifera]